MIRWSWRKIRHWTSRQSGKSPERDYRPILEALENRVLMSAQLMELASTLSMHSPMAITSGPAGNNLDRPLSATGRTIIGTAGVEFSGVVASFIDSDPNPGPAGAYSATVAWGDGTSSVGLVQANGAGAFLVTGAHTYPASGSFSIAVTITDHDTSHDLGGRVAVAVSSATIGSLNSIDFLTAVPVSNLPVPASASVAQPPPTVNAPPPAPAVFLPPAVFLSLINQTEADLDDRGMGQPVVTDQNPQEPVDPTQKNPDQKKLEESESDVLESPQLDSPLGEDTLPTFDSPGIINEDTAKPNPDDIWSLPTSDLVTQGFFQALIHGDQAQPMAEEAPATEASNSLGAVIMLLAFGLRPPIVASEQRRRPDSR
jgi:hypothetical protein